MAPSRSFSIFLLKQPFDAANALEDESTLIPSESADNLPSDASVFILDSKPHAPWWKKYFGIHLNLMQESKGAIVFLPAEGRVFALCFGHVSHNLKDESYEYDFGIKTTLNCVDPTKLKNTDTLEPGSARRQRTQHAIETELTYFDFDADNSILKSITGKVKPEHADLVKGATGASNLRITTQIEPDELRKLCARLLELYANNSYLTSFPDLQKIVPVRDPAQINTLNDALATDVRRQGENVRLAVPNMVDYSNNDSLYAEFSGAGRSMLFPDVSIDHYYDYLTSSGTDLRTLTIENLKTQRLHLTNDNGDRRGGYSLFKALIYDTTLKDGGATYYLNEGNWYEVDRAYIRSLQTRLDPFWSDLTGFLPACQHHLEGDYNDEVGHLPGFVCLDKTSVSPIKKNAIEPCDVYTVKDGNATLIHVKISTGSSLLSHLFNQGANSVELLKSDDDALQQLVSRIQEKATTGSDIDELTKPVDERVFAVVFAIITRKAPSQKSLNLPLFSRISLARNVRALHRVMSVPVSFGFIELTAPPKPAKTKPRQQTKAKKAR